MTREELIQFLQMCIDAEEGLRESRRMAEVLAGEYREIDSRIYDHPLPSLHGEPVMDPPFVDMRTRTWLDYYQRELRDARLSLQFKRARELKEKIEKEEERQREAEAAYRNRDLYEAARVARYEKAKKVWDQRNKVYQSMIRAQGESVVTELIRQKREQEHQSAYFEDALAKLYGTGVVYEKFREPAALAQLKEYLEMGVADTLEGADGAYRLYLEDLRVDRVVGSMQELEEAVNRGFQMVSAGQKALYEQMLKINISIQEVDRGVRSHFQTLYDQIAETGKDLADAVTESSAYEQELMSKISRDQSRIRDLVARSAYNSFLVERKNNLDNYLVYQLQNPLI